MYVYNDEGRALKYGFHKNHVKGGPYCQSVSLFELDKDASYTLAKDNLPRRAGFAGFEGQILLILHAR